jgi:Secretion system C-terminal sorting domain
MKNLVVLLLFFFCSSSYAQDASTYFPAVPGYTWNYKIFRLDSANNKNDSMAYFRVDSFAVTQNYEGKSANVIVSMASNSLTTPLVPLPDSTFIALEGSDAYIYYKLDIDSLISSFSSSSSSKMSLKKLNAYDEEGWFSFYKFAQTENQSYQILLLDKTVNYKGLPLEGRFEAVGIRLTDQNLQTDVGNFNCKKFVINYNISVKLFGGSYSKLFTISDTAWFAANQWIVQDIIPTVIANPLGLGEIFIRGSEKILIPPQIPTGINDIQAKVNEFKLYQNYPNPFNPSTKIGFRISDFGLINLKIYDVLGREVATLVNEKKPAGTFEVTWNAVNVPSGVYFYQLKAGSYTATKKLLLLK